MSLAVVLVLATMLISSHAADLTLFRRNHQPPTFDAYPFGETIVAGTRVTLICNTTRTPFIAWFYRPVGQTGSTGQNVVLSVLKNNFTVEPQKLIIPSFAKLYEFDYECSYQDPDNLNIARNGGFFTLYLAVAPEPIVFDTPNVNQSSTATLTCSTPAARPKPDYIEIHRASTLLARAQNVSTITHRISNVKLSDAGTYSCSAENKAGKGSGSSVLVVQTIPKVSSPNATQVTTPQGSSAALLCEATGIPDPVVQWLKDGVAFRQGSLLQLVDLKEVDTAKYTCVGRNDAGQKTLEINVFVQIPPGAPSVDEASTTKTNVTITLSWKQELDGYSPIVAYEVQYKASTDSTWMTSLNFTAKHTDTSFTVSGLDPYVNYDFRVSAMNALGASPHSNVSTIRTHPNAPRVGPTNLSNGTVGLQTAVVNWDLPVVQVVPPNEASILYYEVAYTFTSGQDVVESSKSTVSNMTKSLTLTQLAKGTTYEVAVYARNSGPYRSPPSNKIVIVTETSLPDAPTQLTVVSSTATTVNVSWMAPLDAGGLPILRYEVRYNVMGAGEVITEVVESSRLSYSIRGLGPARQYQITVWAVNAKGRSESVTAIARTQSSTFNAIELTPRSVVRNGEREIDFVFETVQPDAVASYKIQFTMPGSREIADPAEPQGVWKTRSIEANADGIVRLEGLEPGHFYFVRAKAVPQSPEIASANYSNELLTYTEYFLGILELIARPSSFKIGETVTLTCRTPEGDAAQNATFYFNGKPLPPASDEDILPNQYRIDVATESDDGIYKCVDVNKDEGEVNLQLAGKYRSTRSKGAPIAGGVAVAVIVGICLLIALVWYCRSRGQGEKKDGGEVHTTQVTQRNPVHVVDEEAVIDAPRRSTTAATTTTRATEIPMQPIAKSKPSPPPYSREPEPGFVSASMMSSNPGYGQVTLRDSSADRISESPPSSRRASSPPRETAV